MRFRNALFYSFIFSLYIGCFYFAFGVFYTLVTNGDTTSFLGEFLVAMLACYGLLTAVFYELGGLLEELNKLRPDHRNKNNSTPTDVDEEENNDH